MNRITAVLYAQCCGLKEGAWTRAAARDIAHKVFLYQDFLNQRFFLKFSRCVVFIYIIFFVAIMLLLL